MIFQEYKVPFPYDDFIKSIYRYECAYPEKYRFFIPDGNPELMVSDHPISITVNSKIIISNQQNILWGQIRFTGNIVSLLPYSVWGIKFQPWILPIITHGQNQLLLDRVLIAEDVFSTKMMTCFRDLFSSWDFSSPDHQSIIDLSEVLINHFKPMPEITPDLSNVFRLIEQKKGLLGMTEILASFERSVRKLQYDFQQFAGLTPKAYIDMVRFRKACLNLKAGGTILDSALAFGYYDQPHFNRQFRSLCGRSPSTFLKQDNMLLSTL